MTKDQVIVDGEKIYFDEPFDEAPDRTDSDKWLHRVENLLETLFCSKVADEAIHD